MAGVCGGHRACRGSESAVREAYINSLISLSLLSFAVQLYSQQQAQNFLNTSNHFHALEMATFDPISYTYVPTAPRFKSAAARRNPTSKQSSILDKLQRSKLSGAALEDPQLPAQAVADNNGGYRSGIQGMF